jgi:Leucine-rich repeat (LRR) protein
MEIEITKENMDQYTDGIFYNVGKIKWTAGKLVKGIINNFPNLTELNCSFNKITTLKELGNCINLQILDCSNNLITTIEGLRHCVNLKTLDCSHNHITTLEGLSNCVNLQRLCCHDNHIVTLDELINCVILQQLDCRRNNIITLEGLKNSVNLEKLYIECNRITTLEGLINCVNILCIECNMNQITTLEGLSNSVNLQELYCSSNEITTLLGLINCVNLEILCCGRNRLITLDGLSNCINLLEISCSNNSITSLKGLYGCTNLEKLHCNTNQITTLEELRNCVSLKILNCRNNQITTLEGLRNCVNLRKIYCSNNQITTLNVLIYLRNLISIDYSDNPIEIQNIQIERILDRMQINKKSSVYKDKQNVHDIAIQRSVCDSVQNLLNDPKPIFSIEDIINSALNEKTKIALIEYCQDKTLHSVHLITYAELLSYVWNRIIKSDHRTELMRILEEQIAESECKCFTGRFNRTLSVLVGYYDDIKINISDNSRIGAIILNCREKIIPYNLEKHKEMAITELIGAGYEEDEIKTWIEAIDE